jgi:XTP/dITP diphosphohydrolase
MTLLWPNNKSYTSKGIVEGTISKKKIGKNGFGYDPIFIPEGYSKTFAEMTSNLKISIDHRSKAYFQIKQFFD